VCLSAYIGVTIVTLGVAQSSAKTWPRKSRSELIMTGRAMGLTRSRGHVALIAASTPDTSVEVAVTGLTNVVSRRHLHGDRWVDRLSLKVLQDTAIGSFGFQAGVADVISVSSCGAQGDHKQRGYSGEVISFQSKMRE
jgi:hypothetical protein